MASGECTRENEVIRAAWRQAPGLEMDADLAAHVAQCPNCAEIAWLAQAFRDERDVARAHAHPPSAGVVWWRAQRRAREEAARHADAPVALVHAIALGCTGAAAVAILSLAAGRTDAFVRAACSLASRAALQPFLSPDAATLLPYGSMLVLGASLVLAPVAIYLAVREP